jgi:hypothetical protein
MEQLDGTCPGGSQTGWICEVGSWPFMSTPTPPWSFSSLDTDITPLPGLSRVLTALSWGSAQQFLFGETPHNSQSCRILGTFFFERLVKLAFNHMLTRVP